MNALVKFSILVLGVLAATPTTYGDPLGFEGEYFLHSKEKRRGGGLADFSSKEADAIVERHNYHRANTKPSAANMLQMKWDSNLATMAQNFVEKCIIAHGGTSGSDNITPYSWVGQNWALGSYDDSSSGVASTDRWHEEDQYYSYASDWCSSVCGHYTQVVWAETETVGCGRKLCNGQYFVVCNYGPGGNWMGKKPFIKGKGCSQCPAEASSCTADGRLCTSSGGGGSSGNDGVGEDGGSIDDISGGSDGNTASSDGGGSSGSDGGSDGNTVCEDSNARCVRWARRGECDANPDWMLKNCRLSCKVCEGPPVVCEDQDSQCAAWAKRGECEANPTWMQNNCKLSCGNCGSS